MLKNESSTLSFFVLPDLASPKRARPSSMLNSHAMQSLMQNPEGISAMIQSNPQIAP